MEPKLQEIFDYYKNETMLEKSELVIAILTEVQEAAGFLSKEVQSKTAEIAGVSSGYISAVIKNLPHLHSQAFQHEVRVCISERCKIRKGAEVLKEFQHILKIRPGQVSRDGKFLLVTDYCMHNCVKGPNVKIDGVLYENVQPSDVPALIQKFM